ncbi:MULTISPECIES: family 16 glycoside hydrolase [unclassified Arenibacter]|uniref:family 16 glycoside hydrolase n=1 Tax=unclassified Arenibacter TaxID=2615047 RepID=UPI001C6F3787|nr:MULTISPECIES: family 16 glycoside hydrolase [unclassified Arenibacter]
MSKLKFEKPINLFNGKDLSGWKLIDPNKSNGFKVVDGILMNDPVQPEDGEHISYGNIRTQQDFSDFNLKLEVMVH